MRRIELLPLARQIDGTEWTRRCAVRRFDNDQLIDEEQLWFRSNTSVEPPADDDCDSYLISLLMDAMGEGREVVVHGSVSASLLSNLFEFQSAWSKWLPDRLRVVEIHASNIRTDDPFVPGAVSAFSGGVDATFSAWRHSQKLCGHRSQDLKLCIMVHGLDIPLSDEARFEGASRTAAQTLADIGLTLAPIRTNLREVVRANWIDAFGTAVAASLINFKNVAGTGVIASSEPYDAIVIPCGSNPVTDALLGSDSFKILHDGASHSRTEKVQALASWSVGIENLRVCWQSAETDGNCGTCEKCLRTKLNFLAAGVPVPGCLGDPDVQPAQIKGVALRGAPLRADWRQIYEFTQRNNVSGTWVTALSKRLRRADRKAVRRERRAT